MSNICLKCGAACCKEIRIPLSPASPVLRWESQFVKKRGMKFEGQVLIIPSVCPRLKNDRCTIHDKKPKSCKEFTCQKIS